MRGPVPETLASKPAGLPRRARNRNRKQKYVLHQNWYVLSTSGILYPWYKVVQDGMYWYEPVRTLVDTRPYKKPQIGTRQYVLTSVIPRSVRTGMYWYVLTCTIWYKVVQGGTRWYKAV
jgi:hypothetical protein